MENSIILYTTIDGKAKVELYEMNDNIYKTLNKVKR